MDNKTGFTMFDIRELYELRQETRKLKESINNIKQQITAEVEANDNESDWTKALQWTLSLFEEIK